MMRAVGAMDEWVNDVVAKIHPFSSLAMVAEMKPPPPPPVLQICPLGRHFDKDDCQILICTFILAQGGEAATVPTH